MTIWRRASLILLACTTLAALGTVLAVIVSTTGRAFPYLAALAIALVGSVPLYRRWMRDAAIRRFRTDYPGKDLILVYTDSPYWLPYIEQHWLPQWTERAVTFNRSRPWSVSQPEAQLWSLLAGPTEHTPLAIVVPPKGRPEIIRFWFAFRDYKHGKERLLRAAESQLAKALLASRPMMPNVRCSRQAISEARCAQARYVRLQLNLGVSWRPNQNVFNFFEQLDTRLLQLMLNGRA